MLSVQLSLTSFWSSLGLDSYLASAAVHAGLVEAVIHLHLAVGTREAGGAFAGVTALPRVRACSAVPTWLVVRTVIQIYNKRNKHFSNGATRQRLQCLISLLVPCVIFCQIRAQLGKRSITAFVFPAKQGSSCFFQKGQAGTFNSWGFCNIFRCTRDPAWCETRQIARTQPVTTLQNNDQSGTFHPLNNVVKLKNLSSKHD